MVKKTSKSVKNIARMNKRNYNMTKEFYGKKVAKARFAPTNKKRKKRGK